VQNTFKQKAAQEKLVKLIPSVNFINIHARIFRMKFWFQSRNVTRKKDVRTKKRAFNVDEIDGWKACKKYYLMIFVCFFTLKWRQCTASSKRLGTTALVHRTDQKNSTFKTKQKLFVDF
jgi:hypothetical protein